jgi:hypothetical protein
MTMKYKPPTIAALAVIVMSGVFTTVAKADEWNKKTNITINQAIQVQDTVLQPGSYVLKLVDLAAERYLVEILDKAGSRVITTVFTVPTLRNEPVGDSQFNFYASESAAVPELHTWFYPGDLTGFEFRPGRRGPVPDAVSQAGAPKPSGTPAN